MNYKEIFRKNVQDFNKGIDWKGFCDYVLEECDKASQRGLNTSYVELEGIDRHEGVWISDIWKHHEDDIINYFEEKGLDIKTKRWEESFGGAGKKLIISW